MALCTQDDIESLLQITFTNDPEPVVTTLIELIQGEMEGPRGANRTFEASAYTEVLDAPYTRNVWLENTPVNSITSVTEDGDTLTEGADFLLYGNRGRLLRTTSSGYPQNWQAYKPQAISVVYNGGYSTVPDDVRNACAQAVARLFRWGASASASLDAGSEGVKRIRLEGADEIEYFEDAAVEESQTSMIEAELAIARGYRRQVVG